MILECLSIIGGTTIIYLFIKTMYLYSIHKENCKKYEEKQKRIDSIPFENIKEYIKEFRQKYTPVGCMECSLSYLTGHFEIPILVEDTKEYIVNVIDKFFDGKYSDYLHPERIQFIVRYENVTFDSYIDLQVETVEEIKEYLDEYGDGELKQFIFYYEVR